MNKFEKSTTSWEQIFFKTGVYGAENLTELSMKITRENIIF